ncbi:MAG: hypothetical protein AAGC60_21155 [Acidobacteriota bacterium]
MRTVALSIALVIAILSTTACGSMQVRRLGPDSDVEGLRVQVPVPHEIVTVVHQDGERALGQARMMLPAEDEFYELDFKGGKFKSRALQVIVHPNGALKSYTFTTTEKLSEALQQSADAIDSLAGAAETIAESREEADPLEAENASLELEILNQMLLANRQALEDGRPLPFPGIVGAD